MSLRIAPLASVATVILAACGFTQDHENPFEKEVQEILAHDQAHPPRKGGVVFVGSSSIRLWKTLAQDYPHHNVINRGFGGSQLSDSVYFAKRLVTPLQPQMVVLFAGTNDIASGKSAEQVALDFQQFVSVIRETLPRARIAYISISPAPSRFDKIQEIRKANALIRTDCISGQNLVFIDTFPYLLTQDGNPRPELYGGDLLHLNKQGYELWSKIIAPYLPWGTAHR